MRSRIRGILTDVDCETCGRPATGIIDHPILGQVYTCNRCADIAGTGIDRLLTAEKELEEREEDE